MNIYLLVYINSPLSSIIKYKKTILKAINFLIKNNMFLLHNEQNITI